MTVGQTNELVKSVLILSHSQQMGLSVIDSWYKITAKIWGEEEPGAQISFVDKVSSVLE